MTGSSPCRNKRWREATPRRGARSEQVQQCGMAGGKSECWYVLDAAPDARLGIGMCRNLTSQELRAAAHDGSIETLMEWKPVKAGSFY